VSDTRLAVRDDDMSIEVDPECSDIEVAHAAVQLIELHLQGKSLEEEVRFWHEAMLPNIAGLLSRLDPRLRQALIENMELSPHQGVH
jgi:hypothetical protein